jgi:hypothetical protein
MTLYAVEPDADTDRPSVIASLEHGGSLIADTVALWRLVDDRRAQALRDFLNRAEEADPDGHPYWDPGQVAELLDLVSGLEERLQDSGVLAADWTTPLDQVPELARRVPSLDARPERTEMELRQALAEVVFRVAGLRSFLARTAERGLGVELS